LFTETERGGRESTFVCSQALAVTATARLFFRLSAACVYFSLIQAQHRGASVCLFVRSLCLFFINSSATPRRVCFFSFVQAPRRRRICLFVCLQCLFIFHYFKRNATTAPRRGRVCSFFVR
jgi:hypothetical protein